MKKSLIFLICILMVIILLAGCGKTPSAASAATAAPSAAPSATPAPTAKPERVEAFRAEEFTYTNTKAGYTLTMGMDMAEAKNVMDIHEGVPGWTDEGGTVFYDVDVFRQAWFVDEVLKGIEDGYCDATAAEREAIVQGGDGEDDAWQVMGWITPQTTAQELIDRLGYPFDIQAFENGKIMYEYCEEVPGSGRFTRVIDRMRLETIKKQYPKGRRVWEVVFCFDGDLQDTVRIKCMGNTDWWATNVIWWPDVQDE